MDGQREGEKERVRERESNKVIRTDRGGGGSEGGEVVLREETHPLCSGGSNVSWLQSDGAANKQTAFSFCF